MTGVEQIQNLIVAVVGAFDLLKAGMANWHTVVENLKMQTRPMFKWRQEFVVLSGFQQDAGRDAQDVGPS